MTPSFRRTLALVAAGLLLWGSWYGWTNWKTTQAINALKDVVRSADLDQLLSDPPAEVKSSVDLAIRGIMLTQGQDGRKSFDLKADWATLNQDSGAITVRDPYVVYMMDNDEKGQPRTVHATSKIGRVEDGNQKVSMSENVYAQYEDNALTGDFAVFVSQINKLSFPGGAVLHGTDISGSCARLTWDLDTNTIMGDHGVKMRWYPRKTDLNEKTTDAANAQEGR